MRTIVRGAARRPAFEIGALITFLTLSMYVLGYLKLAILYASLDCLWVLKFNSAQDFILQGGTGVSVAFVTALIFSLGRNPVEGADRSLKIISIILVLWMGSAIAISQFASIGRLMLALMSEVVPYSLMGPCFYALYWSYKAKALRRARVKYILGCLNIVAMSLFLYWDEKYKEIIEGVGTTYMVTQASVLKKSILVGSVNGKYLVRLCGRIENYSIIEPGVDWIVSSVPNASYCN